MLGSAGPATASLYTATTTASATPSSPTRPSRLRGLSYLRSYTHHHLHHLHRPDPDHPLPPPLPPLTRSTSSPAESLAPADTPATTQPSAPPRASAAERIHPTSTIHSGEHGWIPTIQGRSGLNRTTPHPTSTSTEPAIPEPSTSIGIMTRSRTATAFGPTASNTSARRQSSTEPSPTIEPSVMSEPSATPNAGREQLPTIRFIPHVESRSSRPSLQFDSISRTLKTPNSVVKVGRYSERDNANSDVVGFKSKVVSRRHCEFWCTEGQWYVKDVKSSSGTFLNHVRLSSPGVESRPYPLNDGDVVQLGIDFKGGEEVIFRCVKIRIECNRGWQKSLNTFNTSAHKRLFKSAVKAKIRDSDTASVNSSECSICLNPVAPCQALFVAPCSHVWHYKCIRNLIHGPNYPNFLCPNCRFVADLDADVEQPDEEEFEDFLDPHTTDGGESSRTAETTPNHEHSDSEQGNTYDPTTQDMHESRDSETDDNLTRLLHNTNIGSSSPLITETPIDRTRTDRSSSPPPTLSQPIAITPARLGQRSASDIHGARSTTPTSTTQFALSAGRVTPRNDVGPFVIDGNAGREQMDASNQAVPEVNEPDATEDRAGQRERS